MYQRITIIGNVGKPPKMKYTSQGAGVCSFSVAVNKSWTDRNTNEKREKTTWFRISAWRNLGETCSQYVKKGMLVMVSGEVDVNAWSSAEGSRGSLELTAYEVKFLSRVETEQHDTAPWQAPNGEPPPPEDDIPF